MTSTLDLATSGPSSPLAERAYDVLPLGVCVVDASLRVEQWNTTLESWTGVNRSQIVGRCLSSYIPAVLNSPLKSRLTSVFRDGVSIVLSAALHNHFLPQQLTGGVVMPQRTHVRPLDAGHTRAVIVVEDLSQPMAQLEQLRQERRRLESSEASLRDQREALRSTNLKLQEASERAKQASRAKSEFLANMSHEIRTPLTAIMGFADILLEENDPEMMRHAAETVQRNGEHLLAIVNDILDLSKIEAGRFRIEQSGCSPAAIAEEVVSLMRVHAQEKGLALNLVVEEGVPAEVLSDGVRLRQILLNLVGNAVKFTQQGSVSVHVQAVVRGGEPALSMAVVDTGIGIPADKVESVFEPFSQADSSAQRRFGGTGLGLAICSRLARMLGGEIYLVSEIDRGSTFRLAVPIRLPSQPSTKQSSPAQLRDCDAANSSRPLFGYRVLVAEDGPDNQRLVAYHLTKAGAEVHLAGDGQQAVKALLGDGQCPAGHFDLVLMDMQMPVLDGYQATETLRARGYAGPIVALTAHAMEGDRQKALAAGCDDYATKPINAPKLVETIRHHIQQAPCVSH